MARDVHNFTPFLTDGKSPHPLQRMGSVALHGFPVMGAAGGAGLGRAPPAAMSDLGTPPVLDTSITAATRNPAHRV